jgi:hypothetical protein
VLVDARQGRGDPGEGRWRSFWTTAFIRQSHRKVSDHAQVWKSHQHDKRLLSLAVMHQVFCASKIPPRALGSVI